MLQRDKGTQSIFHKHSNVVICLFLCVATASIYWQVHQFAFVDYDDTDYILRNPQVQQGITGESILWAFTAIHASNWHPLTWISHMIDVEISGLEPGRHHVTSLLFHLANALLLFFVLKKMTGAAAPSALVAALFALHPLHVESVAWISERKDVSSAFFFMLTLWSYGGYVRHSSKWRYSLVVLFFAMGLMSKPMLVTLPFMLLLLDFWPYRRFAFNGSDANSAGPKNLPVTRLIFEKIPLFFLSAISCWITFYAQQNGGAVKSLEYISFSSRVANALTAYIGYICKMICPVNLSCLYPFPGVIPWWRVAGAILIFTVVSLMAVRLVKKHPYILVGWLWYLGALIPVIGLVQVGNQAMADRYTYIPLIGLFIIIAWGMEDLPIQGKHRRAGYTLASIVIICILMAVSWKQVGYWKDSRTLFEHAVNVTSDNFIAHYNLANVIAKQVDKDEAISHYRKALEISPDFADAHINLGNVYHMQGRLDEAVDQYRRALKLRPDNPGVHYNLGVIFNKQGDLINAIAHYSQAIHLKPDYEEAYFKLGVALYQKGDIDGAINNFREVLRIDPGNAETKMNIDKLLIIKNKQ